MKSLIIPIVLAMIARRGSDEAVATSTVVITGGLIGAVTAGPVFPVEADPTAPGCAPIPVGDARIIVFGADGATVGHTLTDPAGEFVFELAPGSYEIVAEPVEGFPGTPSPTAAVVDDGFGTIDLEFDTAIR